MSQHTFSLVSAPIKALWRLLLMLAGAYALLRLWVARNTLDFRGRIVVISGGSRGLGLAIARELLSQGARVALLARKEAELQRAEAQLLPLGGQIFLVPCDVTDQVQAKAAIEKVVGHWGGIDMLVNNAGTIEVGPVEHMTREDFQQAMDLHFWAPFSLTEAALPHLRRTGNARIVNVSSSAGVFPVPHMAPYVASKHALAGYSQALALELAKDGVMVTTVCPGIIRTGSHVAATFKGRHEAEYTAFKLAAALPTNPLAGQAARKIVAAARVGEPLVLFPFPIWLARAAFTLMPGIATRVLGLATRIMPGPTEPEEGDQLVEGREVEARMPESIIARLGHESLSENNQMNGYAVQKSS